MVPYLFILPAFIIHACIVTGPALSTLVMSLFDWNGMGNAKFIGFQNFSENTLRFLRFSDNSPHVQG
jgi:raffinose/stachyose/melibiose transport system permease protein